MTYFKQFSKGILLFIKLGKIHLNALSTVYHFIYEPSKVAILLYFVNNLRKYHTVITFLLRAMNAVEFSRS